MSLAEDEKHSLEPTEIKRQCPLCGIQATYNPFSLGKKRRFFCKICIRFIVFSDMEEDLFDLPKKQKDEYSRMARECAKNKILVLDIKRNLTGIITSTESPTQVYNNLIIPSYEPRNNWW